MCLIVYSSKGGMMDRAAFNYARQLNPDGIGIMSEVGVEKFLGKKSAKKAWQMLELLAELEVPWGLHFRWATHGDVQHSLCHPFQAPGSDAWVMHNGVISRTSKDATKLDSDTSLYVARHMKDAPPPVSDEAKAYYRTIEQDIGHSSKLLVFHREARKFTICNELQGEWKEGFWYSNTYSLPHGFIPRPVSSWHGWAGESYAPTRTTVSYHDRHWSRGGYRGAQSPNFCRTCQRLLRMCICRCTNGHLMDLCHCGAPLAALVVKPKVRALTLAHESRYYCSVCQYAHANCKCPKGSTKRPVAVCEDCMSLEEFCTCSKLRLCKGCNHLKSFCECERLAADNAKVVPIKRPAFPYTGKCEAGHWLSTCTCDVPETAPVVMGPVKKTLGYLELLELRQKAPRYADGTFDTPLPDPAHAVDDSALLAEAVIDLPAPIDDDTDTAESRGYLESWSGEGEVVPTAEDREWLAAHRAKIKRQHAATVGAASPAAPVSTSTALVPYVGPCDHDNEPATAETTIYRELLARAAAGGASH